MYEQQLDLFSSAGIQAECPLPQSMELRPAPTATTGVGGRRLCQPRAADEHLLEHALNAVGNRDAGRAKSTQEGARTEIVAAS
jgi:hypothetical protein